MKNDDTKRKDLIPFLKEAKFYAWISVGYLFLDAILLILVSKDSQAIKAAWIEDFLYILPSLTFLIATNFVSKAPNKKFRFGYDRAYSVGFVVSAFTLFGVGSFILLDSLMKLINQEMVTTGTIYILDQTIWFGWFQIAALSSSIIPVYLLGKKKQQLADILNIEMLNTDAKGQKAHWMTSIATVIGILGVGFGVWWADAAAALFISLDIIYDGFKSIIASITEEMDRTPLDPQQKSEESLVKTIESLVEKENWIKDSLVRLRKAGNKTSGEVLIILKTSENLENNLYDLQDKIESLHWHMANVVVTPVKKLPELYDKTI